MKDKLMEKMEQNKAFVVVIILLVLLVLGLIVYIIYDKSSDDDTSKATTEVTTEATEASSVDEPEEASDDVADQSEEADDKSSDDTSKDKADKSDDASKKYACYAKLSAENNWNDGDAVVYQYSLDIHNKSDEDISDWEVKISGFEGGTIGDSWNGTYKISGDTLSVKSVDYNSSIPANTTTNVGFQIKFKDSDKASADKEAVLYVNGEEYVTEKEEPTTQSEEEKAESKKEKKEPETGTPVDNHGKLSISGTDIVDKDGKPYQLKGVSTHGLAWFPDYVNKEAFQTLRDDWGANLIRLAMYTAESGGYCQDGDKTKLKALVDDGVDYATELGMYVIIDWHILHDTNPQDNQDEAVMFFDEMSAKYADYDNVLYEICNEPNGSTTWADIKEYAEAVIPVIRANDKDAIIIVGTPTWSQDVDMAAEDPITGEDNIAYTTHFYAATHKDNIRSKVKTAHEKGLCVFISEFSICDASGNGGIDYDSAEDWFDLIDEYNLSYAGWSLCNKDETSALIDSGCKKTSGWEEDDLSDTGKWLKGQISGE